MSDEKEPVLARKVRGATISLDGFPELTNMSVSISKAAGGTVGELLNCAVQASVSSVRIQQLKDALHKAPNFGSYSWVKDTSNHDGVLVVVSNPFVAMLTERLLGGPLSEPTDKPKISEVDVQISYQLVEALIPALNRTILKMTGPEEGLVLASRESVPSPEEVMGDLDSMTTFDVVIDFLLDDISIASALRLSFPVDYVERAGLLASRGSTVTTMDSSPWRQKLSHNVRSLCVDVEAMLWRFEHTIGQISRFSIGDVIPVEEEALHALSLIVETEKGPAVIAKGRLGAYKDRKAIKLSSGVDPDFVPPF